MPRRTSEHPTEAELEILNVLWRKGPSTVRRVHEILQGQRQTTMTTTLKLLQMMTDKGITTRNDTRPHLYAAAVREEKTQAGLLVDLVRKAFSGSVGQLVMRAVEQGDLSADEMRQIRKLMDSRRHENRGAK
jgi:BlaI family transcriptional regulator, penicillinase repressor